MTAPVVGVGDEAPDFTLRDQNNEQVVLSALRGAKAALLVFYPLAFTGMCTGELRRLRDELDTFQNERVQVLTISVDSVYTHKVFSAREGYEFPLLSDFWPHGAVAQQYATFNDTVGFANRGTFLVDRRGIIRFCERNGPGEARDPAVWQAAIKALPD